MAQITLLGGLASTTFWPLGNALIELLGWRGALLAYAAISLAAIPLYFTLPTSRRPDDQPEAATAAAAAASSGETDRVAGWLYAAIMALVAFLNSAMSAHMIGILVGLGLGASTAVWVASLRGVGQTTARACDVVFGAGLSPLTLNLIAASLRAIYDNLDDESVTGPAQARIDAWRTLSNSYVQIPTIKAMIGLKSGNRGWRRVRPPLLALDEAQFADLAGKYEALP